MRPARRLRQLTVFLRLEISWVLAVSPRYLDLGPKPTSELEIEVLVVGSKFKVLIDVCK